MEGVKVRVICFRFCGSGGFLVWRWLSGMAKFKAIFLYQELWEERPSLNPGCGSMLEALWRSRFNDSASSLCIPPRDLMKIHMLS